MVCPPLLQHYLKKRNIFDNEKEKKNKSLTMKKGMNVRSTVALNIINVLFVGLCSAVATPMCIALFDQQSSIPLQYLERDVQQAGKNFYCDDKLHNDDIQKNDKKKEFFAYFNKGL